jgi:Cu-Zn family superoxide dismutase
VKPDRARSAGVLVIGVLALLAGGCGGDDESDSGSGGETVELQAVDGAAAGTVTLSEVDGAVEVEAEVTGLSPGFHGFHVHETATCDPDAPEAPFDTAGGHHATAGQTHGDHAGDLPTLLADPQGNATATVRTTEFTLDELADSDGSAVMVHAMRDNQANVPGRYMAAGKPGPDADTLDTGDSGDRIACGLLGA